MKPELRFLTEDGSDTVGQLPPPPVRIDSEYLDGTGIGKEDTGHQLDCRGFTGAVRSDKGEDLTGIHRKAQIVDCSNVRILRPEYRPQRASPPLTPTPLRLDS